jgi:hypothetical protein
MITHLENRIGSMLFSCASSAKSKLTRGKLSAEHGADAFNHARANEWIIPSSCDEHAAKTAFLITLKGRDALRDINNRAV